jgi:ferric-dicitrate binding protein FerR (iron transport regulator)
MDWALIDRYLARECSEGEVRFVEARRVSEPAFRDALQAAALIRDVGRDHAPQWDLDHVWRGVVRQTGDAQDPVKVRMPHRQTGRPAILTWGRLAAAALAAVSLATWMLARPGSVMRPQAGRAAPRDYTTATGERLAVTLTDGTQVTLAPHSHLRVPAAYGLTARDVALEGEGVFTAVHDPHRLFTVRTAQAVTRDIGTTFDIMAYPEATTTRVVVAEGRVDVRGVPLVAGQLGVVASHGVPEVTSGVRISAYLAWRTGEVVFDATPMPEVMTTIGRWYDVDVRSADPALMARHVTATFTNAPLDEVLTSLAATLAARVERHGRVVTLTPLLPGSR